MFLLCASTPLNWCNGSLMDVQSTEAHAMLSYPIHFLFTLSIDGLLPLRSNLNY